MRDRKNRGNGGPPPRAGRSDQSPHDMSDGHDDRLDLADLAAVRADDDLLDALASGRPLGVYVQHGRGVEDGQAGFTDDQAVLALLGSWQRDIESDTFPELLTIEEAAKAIAAGQRATRPRRRLMPVAAAAVAVIALAGVGVAAGHATPDSPLWGLSTLLDGQRAQSAEATETVSVALAAAQQELAEGKVYQAKAVLAKVAPELKQIRDQHSKQQLALKIQNLQDTANYTPEGESVPTDPDGAPTDHRHPVWSLLRSRGEGGRDSTGTSGQRGADSSSSSPSGAGPSSDNGRAGTDLRGPSSAGSGSSTPSGEARPPGGTSGSPQSSPGEGSQSSSGGAQSSPSEGGQSPSGGAQPPPGPDVTPSSGDAGPTTPAQPPVRNTHSPKTTQENAKPTRENDSSRDSTGHSTSGDRSGRSDDRGGKSNGGESDRHHGGEHHSGGRSEGGPDPVGSAGTQQQFGSLRPVSR
jgi:hypothetical protein